MKLCINKKLCFVLGAALFLAACSDSPTSQAENSQPIDPAAESVISVPQPQPSAVEVSPVTETDPAPQKAKPAPLPEVTAQQLTENLKQWDKKLALLETDFEQTSSYDGVEVSRSAGKLFYDRAQNRLRLDTLNPEGGLEQSAVTDKKDIVILDENNQHVTTLSWTDWQQGQPNQALFDFGNYTALVDNHTAAVKSQDGQTAILTLTPKKGEEYTLYLTLSKQDFFPQIITIESELMITQANLTNIHKNQPLPADVFGGFHK